MIACPHEFIFRNSMIISFVSQKGGSGKTTLCVNMAALAFTNGVSVAIIDLDPQASSSSWVAVRNDALTVVSCHPPFLDKTIKSLQGNGYNLILIDTPPHNSTAAANAIRASSFVVVPVRPSSFDLAATSATLDLIKSNSTPCGAVLNAIPSNTTVANSAEDFLIESGFELLGRVGHRMAIQHALTAGLGVVELEPNSSASEDITSLWNKIVERIAV